MIKLFSWLRPWLAPVGLVFLALVLTVPWTILVLLAAYNRDVTENARSLARRVEQSLTQTIRTINARRAEWPFDFGPFAESPQDVIDQRVIETLRTEMRSDPSVQTAVFYTVIYNERVKPPQPEQMKYTAIVRTDKGTPPPELTLSDIELLSRTGLYQKDNKFMIPWKSKERVIGITYVELSKDVLWKEFWKKEGPLVWQVMAWTSTGVVALSVVGIFGYRSWRRLGRVQVRAELARQGMLAERGLTAAVLAHEIRNPLQALRFQLHSLRKNSGDAQRVSGTAETIDSELLRIQQLVTDYLEHEKAISMRVQSVDLEGAARALKTVMDELLRSTETRLNIVAQAARVEVACDPHALRQVLMNLVLNAQQAMGAGGAITIRIGRDDAFGTIDVADTGPGIPEEMRARLFKPFQTSKREGHGIGLALVKRFVDNFGGSVSVDSEMGRGTTFHLKLPVAESMRPAGAVEALPAIPVAQKVEASGGA